MRRLVALVVLAAVVVTACGGAGIEPSSSGPSLQPDPPAATASPPPDVASTPSPAATPSTEPSPAAEPTTVAPPPTVTSRSHPVGVDPSRIEIPAIDVAADVVGLSLAGPSPEVPTDFARAGWYTQTRQPGEIGPAVIAGHIDSSIGPAVFFRLDELAVGDEIVIRDDAGATRTFSVTASGQYLKDDLPPEVFGFGEPEPELRLITCGGAFDAASGHYRDNYVVYARLVAGSGT